ncbi:MAG: alginate export family protein [Planctomycetota bacterium]
MSARAQDLRRVEQFERTLEAIQASRYETTAGLAGGEHSRILYGAYTTLSWLGADDELGATRIQQQVDARFWAEGKWEGHTLYGRIRLRYRDYDRADSFDDTADGLVYPLGDRYWYRFDWRTERRAETGVDPGWNWYTQIGRQYIHWASGLALSEVLYSVRAGLEFKKVRLDGFWGNTPSHTIDFDASRPDFTTDTDRQFWGALADWKVVTHHRIYGYYIDQTDNNNTEVLGSRWGYDSSYAALGAVGQIAGSLLYRIEVIHEMGEGLSDIFFSPQTTEDIDAWAGHVEFVWSPYFGRNRGLRFEFEFIRGTGDSDRFHGSWNAGGNQSGTDDTSFNAFGYVDTGLALAPGLANLTSFKLGASALPFRETSGIFRRFRFEVDTFAFFKTDDDAPMTVTTLPGERYVGFEVDLIVQWQLYSDVSFDFQYGIFIPGDAVAGSDPRHFVYAGVSYGF